jgi:PKD repeat protein
VRWVVALVSVGAVLLVLVSAGARSHRPKSTPDLVQVVTPAPGATVPAHPDVNVIVTFAAGVPGSVRARLNARDVTAALEPISDHGTQVGLRGVLRHAELRLGSRRTNRLKLLVHAAQADAKGRTPRQVVRVRFHAEEMPDKPPVAIIAADSLVLRPGIVVHFDGSQSSDPESDALTYQWDFGDGSSPSTDVAPTHTYASADSSRTVRLTVSDGQLTADATLTLLSCSAAAGHAPGTLAIGADAALEFGAVAPGGSATRSIDVQNTSVDPNSALAVCMAVDDPGFTVTPARLDLGPQERGTFTITFAPATAGHAAATVVLATSAANRSFVSLLGHGYGGSAPGPGPTEASVPAFYAPASAATSTVQGFLPDGTPIAPDTSVHACAVPGNGAGTGDTCVVDSDCAANGGTCPQNASSPFDLAELCSGGAGGLYLLSNDGTYTDPAPSPTDAERSETILGETLDGGGNVTARSILDRTTSETNHLACDAISASDGGHVYVAEHHQLPDNTNCFRSDKESLVSVRKSDGSTQTLLDRIDAAEGLSDCADDIDSTTHLEVSADGMQAFASFDSGGLWRLTPTPLQFLDGSYHEDVFRLHPDGSVVFATIADGATTATVRLFKVSPAQVAANPLAEPGLTPCGTFELPDNQSLNENRSLIAGLGVSPSSPGSHDGTVLVSVATPDLTDIGGARANNLSVRGTIAFSSPADSASCTPLGIINLERMDQLTF